MRSKSKTQLTEPTTNRLPRSGKADAARSPSSRPATLEPDAPADERDSKPDFRPSPAQPLKSGLLYAAGGALLTLLLLTNRQGEGGILRWLGQWLNPQPIAKLDNRTTIVQQVRSASELTTAVFTLETVVPTSRDRTLGNVVIGTTTLLYIAHGEVRAGVDLSTIQDDDIRLENDILYLRLPPPQILDSKIDVNQSSVYDYDRGFMNLGPDAAPELQALAERSTLEKMQQTACTDGILEQANDRAKLVVSQLLQTAGYSNFTVETQLPPATACLPAVAPVTPDVPAN